MSSPLYGGRKAVPSAEECGSVIQFVAAAANGDTLIVGPSYSRRGILLTVDQNTAVYIANHKMTATAQGWPLRVESGAFYLCLYQHGDVVQKEWHIWSGNFVTIVGVIEVMLP